MANNPFDDDQDEESSNGAPAGHRPTTNPFASNSWDTSDDPSSSAAGLRRPSSLASNHSNPNNNNKKKNTTSPRRATTTGARPTGSTNNTTNPLDFDAGFGARSKSTDGADTPILTGMDTDEPAGFGSAAKSQQRQSATAEALRRAQQVTNQWLRGGAGGGALGDIQEQPQHVPTLLTNNNNNNKNMSPPRGTRKKKPKIPTWPFDSYHQVQQVYYETILDQREEQATTTPANDNGQTPLALSGRPAELPDIPTAVQGLALIDFEQKAEDRAIGIVSTWIYDEALMDELWVQPSSIGMVNSSIDDQVSVKSSEGVELNVKGFPILPAADGEMKMDKEMMKLRESTARELALINARLNDGVAASGSEVQELVHAVTKTKGDLGKLRELTTYLTMQQTTSSSIAVTDSTTTALLANYPKLKTAIHARRNLARCFRELDFFAQIPATCDRLRDEMHNSEWQENEWQTLRSVCREHVELEVFLVEAEAGMKKRIDGTDDRSYRHANAGRNTRRELQTSESYGPKTHDSVDRFLEEHAANVWELGDEIKLRVLSGVGTTFDLALNNRTGMVALVEAIELYEAKMAEYKELHGETSSHQRLYFTEMRRSALEKICEDFEERGLQLFQEVQQMAADEAAEDAATAAFNAVLKASNELTNEMDFVHRQMAPCFPEDWAVEALWTSVVARVSSQNLFQQIGGRDGHRLHTLTVTQLLDLVAWIENFFERIQDAFPDIDLAKASLAMPPSSMYDASGANLLHGDGKEIDVERAKDSVVSVSGAMVEVKQLAQTEFIARTQLQTEEWLVNVYNAEHAKTQTEEGRLITSLCEDVYSLAGVQLRTIRERLTKKSDVLVLAVNIIFNSLTLQQRMHRDKFLVDLETCCAAANDFLRMSDSCEDILAELRDATNLSNQSIDDLYEQSNSLLQLYSTDAVFAAQRVHFYVFDPIEEEVGEALFGDEWESTLTHNELALTVVRTLEDYMGDLEVWFEDLMVRKVVDALVIATLNFYIRRLVLKAEKKSQKESSFKDSAKAVQRIAADIAVFREYFEGLTSTFPALRRVIESEFGVMDLIISFLGIAAGLKETDPTELVWEFQKRIKDTDVTKAVVGNLFHTMNPKDEGRMYELIDDPEMLQTLKDLAPKGQDPIDERVTDRGLRLDLVMKDALSGSRRKRTAGSLRASMEKMTNKLRAGGGKDQEADP